MDHTKPHSWRMRRFSICYGNAAFTAHGSENKELKE